MSGTATSLLNMMLSWACAIGLCRPRQHLLMGK
jgi:hypothetical protein